MMEYYVDYCANIERGAYSIASHATEKYDTARKNAANLLLKAETSEFIFTRNLTQGANMAYSGTGLRGTILYAPYSMSGAWSYLTNNVDLAGYTSPQMLYLRWNILY
jgi:selenocysteine lyase/cysteine desulfurase